MTSQDKTIWFKRKRYGWGWYPSTWQGWAITIAYIVVLLTLSFTIDENSPTNEAMFTFILPLILLTITLIRICYKKGETPRWQWGEKESANHEPSDKESEQS